MVPESIALCKSRLSRFHSHNYTSKRIHYYLDRKRIASGTMTANEDVVTVNESLIIYPNPATDLLFVSYNSTSAKKLVMNITNSISQTINTITTDAKMGDNTIRISTADLQNGIYFLKMDEKVTKFIINK